MYFNFTYNMITETTIFQAISFAAEAHAGQFRKATRIPYITHPVHVMQILCEAGCDETTMVAGLLHDVPEDTPYSLGDISASFGRDVADIVAGCVEPEWLRTAGPGTVTWKARKEHTLEHLGKAEDRRLLFVACADKLDNIRLIQRHLRAEGDRLWHRFNAGPQEQEWYYGSLARLFLSRSAEKADALAVLADELQRITRRIFDEPSNGRGG